MVFYRIKKVKGNHYLIKEWYDPETGKKKSKSLGPITLIEKLMQQHRKNKGKIWDRRRDLNPGPPDPQSGALPD